jgi:hypothetical protein
MSAGFDPKLRCGKIAACKNYPRLKKQEQFNDEKAWGEV